MLYLNTLKSGKEPFKKGFSPGKGGLVVVLVSLVIGLVALVVLAYPAGRWFVDVLCVVGAVLLLAYSGGRWLVGFLAVVVAGLAIACLADPMVWPGLAIVGERGLEVFSWLPKKAQAVVALGGAFLVIAAAGSALVTIGKGTLAVWCAVRTRWLDPIELWCEYVVCSTLERWQNHESRSFGRDWSGRLVRWPRPPEPVIVTNPPEQPQPELVPPPSPEDILHLDGGSFIRGPSGLYIPR